MQTAAVSVKTYFRVFIALLALLAITVVVAFLPGGGHGSARDLITTVGFSIAATKAVLIILWFMHVRVGTRLTWIFASAAFAWLAILFVLTLNDYLNRPRMPDSGGPESQIVEIQR